MFAQISTSNAKITLHDTIVLGDVVTSNSKIEGRVYILRGSRVATSNARTDIDIFDMNWEQLYNKAAEFGLISDGDMDGRGGSAVTFNHYGTGDVVGTKTVFNW